MSNGYFTRLRCAGPDQSTEVAIIDPQGNDVRVVDVTGLPTAERDQWIEAFKDEAASMTATTEGTNDE